MFRKSVIMVLLCFAVLVSVFAFSVNADENIEIDLKDLWENNASEENTGDENITYIPEDNLGNGTESGNGGSNNETSSVVGSKEDKDDDKTVVLPTTQTPTDNNKKEEIEIPIAEVNFSDVDNADWFYNDVGALVGMGIINGYPDGTFKPDGNVTRAEFLKLLVTLIFGDNLMETYDMLLDVKPTDWYSKYFVTAFVYGIIDINDYGSSFNPEQPITRREVAKLVVNSITVETGGYQSPFADTADNNIIALYRYAIMQGTVDPVTGYRFFYPDTNISRAETSAVILRLYKLVEGGEDYVQQFMKENNMPALQSLYVPTTKNDFYNVLSNAWDKNQAFVVYNYDFGVGSEQLREIQENLYAGFNDCGLSHPEYYTDVSMTSNIRGNSEKSVIEIGFDSVNENKSYEKLSEEIVLAIDMANCVLDTFIDKNANGKAKADMIHDYILENFEYDFEYLLESYTAYGAFSTGKAVCQGYSSVFNLLCRAAGVKSLAVANDNHMWNAVLIDGKVLFYDTTYDDTGNVNDAFKGVDKRTFENMGRHGKYTVPSVEMFI